MWIGSVVRVILLVQIGVGLLKRELRCMNTGVLEKRSGGLDVAVVGHGRARAW